MTSPVRPDPARLPGIDLRSLDDPFARFALWWQDAKDDSRIGEPAAMSLATADEDGRPSVRIVLLRAFDARGFVFYTNLGSRKGREVQARPQAALCFHWEHEHRQVRVDGEVVAVDESEDVDVYVGVGSGERVKEHDRVAVPVAVLVDVLLVVSIGDSESVAVAVAVFVAVAVAVAVTVAVAAAVCVCVGLTIPRHTARTRLFASSAT